MDPASVPRSVSSTCRGSRTTRAVLDTYGRAAGGLLANGLAFSALFAAIPTSCSSSGSPAGWPATRPSASRSPSALATRSHRWPTSSRIRSSRLIARCRADLAHRRRRRCLDGQPAVRARWMWRSPGSLPTSPSATSSAGPLRGFRGRGDPGRGDRRAHRASTTGRPRSMPSCRTGIPSAANCARVLSAWPVLILAAIAASSSSSTGRAAAAAALAGVWLPAVVVGCRRSWSSSQVFTFLVPRLVGRGRAGRIAGFGLHRPRLAVVLVPGAALRRGVGPRPG